jgi:hypothetical protein
MNKGLVLLTSGFFGAVGGYLPVLFGSSGLSGWSLIGGFVGGIFGIWVGVKIGEN